MCLELNECIYMIIQVDSNMGGSWLLKDVNQHQKVAIASVPPGTLSCLQFKIFISTEKNRDNNRLL